MERLFSSKQKEALFIFADGKCQNCGEALEDWEADHIYPHSKGGETTLTNGQALCKKCNRAKGDFAYPKPRDWQIEFLDAYQKVAYDGNQHRFLLVATPGAGKTIAAGLVAHQRFEADEIDFLIVVAPDITLKEQWAIKMSNLFRLQLHPKWDAKSLKSNYQGVCLTYSQAANHTMVLDMVCAKKRTFVIFDEVHHAADQLTWGEGIKEAFANARYILTLSGTPFRSDNNPIPFVRYENGQSRGDFVYGYGDALKDGVCRNVGFRAFDALVTWIDGDEVYADISFDDDLAQNDIPKRLSIALDRDNKYLRDVLKEADEHLDLIRQDEDPKAGGFIVTKDTDHANGIAEVMREITGVSPVVVHSDVEDKTQELIERFSKSDDKWIVSVKMVSEGVDIPRLRIGVYATTTTTELTFRQIIGRTVRRQSSNDSWSFFYVPKDPRLVALMEVIKEERSHVLGEEKGARERVKAESSGDRLGANWVGIAERNLPGDVMIAEGETYEDVLVREAKKISNEIGANLNDAQAVLLIGRLTAKGIINLPTTPSLERKNGQALPEYRKEELIRKQVAARVNQLAGRWMEKTNRPIGDIIKAIHAAWKKRGGSSQSKSTVEELQQKLKWIDSIVDRWWEVL